MEHLVHESEKKAKILTTELEGFKGDKTIAQKAL